MLAFFPLTAGMAPGAQAGLRLRCCGRANRARLSSLCHISWAGKPVLAVTLTTFLLLRSSWSHSLPDLGTRPEQWDQNELFLALARSPWGPTWSVHAHAPPPAAEHPRLSQRHRIRPDLRWDRVCSVSS